MGKLTPEQLKQRRRKIFLNELTPEWIEYQKKEYTIDDEFNEAIKDMHLPRDWSVFIEAFDKARADKEALILPKTTMWRPGKEPHDGTIGEAEKL